MNCHSYLHEQNLIFSFHLFVQKESAKKIGASALSGFSEGHMGKLIIRKSGRTSLMLGNVVLDVSMGTKCGFLQVQCIIDQI